MNAAAPSEAEADAPLPMTQFKRFVMAFHVVFFFGLLFTLVVRWRHPSFAWSWRDLALIALIVVQAATYLLFFAFNWKPITETRWWLGYFFGGGVLWWVELQFEPALHWVIWAYMGQMFGTLRPALSVPLALAALATWFGVRSGFSVFLRMGVWEWVGALCITTSSTLLGVFLYRLTVTSSERAKLIQKLEAAQRELELARQRDAELATLHERERLARELHDSLGHGLVTLTVQLEAVQRLYPADPARASALLDEMKALTRASMEQLRRALAGLRSPGLGDQPLSPALRTLCSEATARSAIKVQCQLPDQLDHLPPTVAEALWRVAQEALTNIEKHSRAKNAQVSLQLEPRQACLQVNDDGVGLPPNAEAKPGHYGLRGLRERIEGLGGVFSIVPGQPSGVALEARIPLLPA